MATKSTFGNMLNSKSVSKKVMSEDDMALPPIKNPKVNPKKSSYNFSKKGK